MMQKIEKFSNDQEIHSIINDLKTVLLRYHAVPYFFGKVNLSVAFFISH